jgi:gag-polyprotein putative aspartyl protease
MRSFVVSLMVLSMTLLVPAAGEAQSRAQREDAVASWMQLPPEVFACLRQNYGIFPRVWGWRYGIYPSDPSVARQVNVCLGREQARRPQSDAPPGATAHAAPVDVSSTQQLGMFQKGLADRTAWEKWFNNLSGDAKIGAFYWAGQRSLPHPGSCNQMSDAFQMGCREAVVMLSASDALRKAYPAYKAGWNSYTGPDNEVAAPPAAGAGPAPRGAPTPAPEQETTTTTTPPVASAGDEVPLILSGDTYAVPTIVNRTLKLDFMIDSGSSDMVIPADVVLTLIRSGTLSKSDFIGDQTFTLADGRNLQSAQFTLHDVKIGNETIENVVAVVGPVAGSPLLGQSFLSRFGAWSLDNNRHMLILGGGN